MKENLILNLDNKDKLVDICKALSSPVRLDILHFLASKPAIISDIAAEFHIPLSSAALYVKVLENAGLIYAQTIPGSKGSQKLCGVLVDHIEIKMFPDMEEKKSSLLYQESMPVGAYFDYHVCPSCGMASETCYLGSEDNVRIFTLPSRFQAQLIWLSQGYLEYRFSNHFFESNSVNRIKYSFEICSEVLGYNNQWPSDITISINNHEIGIIHCDGDYGDRKGHLNPDWWNPSSTQYGTLRCVEITADGCYIDGVHISDENIYSLELADDDFIRFKLEVKEDARYAGGFNLFGEKFGDYPQNIVMEAFT